MYSIYFLFFIFLRENLDKTQKFKIIIFQAWKRLSHLKIWSRLIFFSLCLLLIEKQKTIIFAKSRALIWAVSHTDSRDFYFQTIEPEVALRNLWKAPLCWAHRRHVSPCWPVEDAVKTAESQQTTGWTLRTLRFEHQRWVDVLKYTLEMWPEHFLCGGGVVFIAG